MDKTFTLKDFIRLINNEKEALRSVDFLPVEDSLSDCLVEEYQPRQSVFDNILNFSKALSVRKSRLIENIEMILN